jgi:DNA-binding transcriptional LysR family regulator
MIDVELKLLTIFEEVYKTRSVSRAGQTIGLSQPSISIGLAKLRHHFNDPLFVRTSRGMEPTPHAEELIGPIREALALLRRAFGHRIVFDPLTSNRAFRICMTDISQVVMLPTLMTHLKTAAPSVRIETLHIEQDTPAILESGEADVGIGFMPQLEAGFYQQKLFEQSFVCMVSRNHPRIRSDLTLSQFVAEAHIVVTTSGTGHRIVDKVLEAEQIERRIALRLPSFLGIALIVAKTDLLVTVPRRLAEILSEHDDVSVLPCPVTLPSYQVKQHWHERYRNDPGNSWLRGVVSHLFAMPGA